MISPSAIKQFLNRPLNDSALAKQFSEAEIDRRISRLNPVPVWKTQPLYLHQKVCFLLGVQRKRYLFLCGLGLGKSWISLAILQYAHQQFEAGKIKIKPRAIVMVPSSSNLGQWAAEARKHSGLSIQGVDASGSGKRLIQAMGEADIVVITYAGFLGLVCSGKVAVDENGEVQLDSKGEPKTKGWKIDKKKLKRFQDRFNFFIGDEITAVRGRKLVFKACQKLSWSCNWSLGLTGTPHGKDPIDLWGQFYVVDKGEAIGDTIGLFRESLFKKKPDFWRGFQWEFDDRNSAKLNRMIRHSSIRYEDTECSDLPELIKIVRRVDFPAENFHYYEKLAKELQDAHGNFAELQTSFTRMRQILAGYVSMKGSDGNKLEIKFSENPKIDELMQILSEIPEERKVVVFHEYKLTGQLICETLRKARISHDWLYSGTKSSIKRDIAERLKTRRVLVASSAAAYGLNLQIANYSIWCERPCDPLVFTQEAKRLHRIGQTRKTYLIDIVVRGSIDERIIASHKSGENLFSGIVNGDFSKLALALKNPKFAYLWK